MTRIGPYTLTEQLHAGCCGLTVHLAEGEAGEQVALRVYSSPDRRRPLDGIGDGYLAGEYVEGPTLAERVPVTGAALERLAIATVTELAALHRSGVRHTELSPSRIVLSPGGARLLHHPPEHHDVLDPSHDTQVVSGHLWSAPEESYGAAAGPASDVFGWAALMAYAASGEYPFASHEQLLAGAADLGPLPEGPLRTLLADCLAVEPDERPTAEGALLRLVEHSAAHDQAPARQDVPRRRGLVLTAAALAIVLVSGAVSFLVTRQATAVPTDWTPRKAAASGVVSDIKLPDGLGVLHESPADPVRLTTLTVPGGTYARDPRSGTFTKVGTETLNAALSPDGRYLAMMDTLYAATANRLDIKVVDHLTGERFAIPVLQPPFSSYGLAWSRRSDKIALTVLRYERIDKEDKPFVQGVVIVDVAARTASFAPTAESEELKAAGDDVDPSVMRTVYRWSPEADALIGGYLNAQGSPGARMRDLNGRLTGMFHWVGWIQGLDDPYSPSGAAFYTTRCSKTDAICVWDATSGKRLYGFSSDSCQYGFGWFDDTHLICARQTGTSWRVAVVDLTGKEVRILADLRDPGKGLNLSTYTKG